MKSIFLVVMLFALNGCLKTRAELNDNYPSDSGTRTSQNTRFVDSSMGQQQKAQIDSRFFEIDRDFRQLYGKIETIERQIAEGKETPQASNKENSIEQDKIKELEKRISTLEEAILSLDKKMRNPKKDDQSSHKTEKPKGPYGYGEYFFEQGKYESAITSYDDYRKKFPKGRHYAQATLKMGLCFQKLKLSRDAKPFYKEVIQRFPNTEVAQRAEANLKSISK
jgi:TolA-binding protein